VIITGNTPAESADFKFIPQHTFTYRGSEYVKDAVYSVRKGNDSFVPIVNAWIGLGIVVKKEASYGNHARNLSP